MAGINFELVGDRELVARVGKVYPAVRGQLASTLLAMMVRCQRIAKEKLSGIVLHVRTGALRRSVIAGVDVEADALVGYFGVPEGPTAVYGSVHEYGGSPDNPGAPVTVKEHLRRITQVWGNTLREPHFIIVKQHQATYPERSFIRSTFDEMGVTIKLGLQESYETAVRDAMG